MLKIERTPLLFVVLAFLIMSSSCRSTKITHKQAADQSQMGAKDICNQIIKYHSEKAIMKSGEELNFITEIIIDPSKKLINLTSTPPNQEKVSFDTVIESFECNMNADLTMGQAIYTGYINQTDGQTTKAVIKVEAKDGNLSILNGEPEKESDFTLVVSKWEIIKE